LFLAFALLLYLKLLPIKQKLMADKGLYVITPDNLHPSKDLLVVMENILEAGIGVLQYRDKSNGVREQQHLARCLSRLCEDYQTPFIINDDLELAANCKAGVHLGRTDATISEARRLLGKNVLIGSSCYGDLERAKNALAAGADYVAFGSVFASTTKPKAEVIGMDFLRQARQSLGKAKICAIGGINLLNAREVLDCGVDYLAVISAVFNHPRPEAIVKQFNRIFLEN
jgi:thiamine-phosphate pyrophosphorylase